MAEREVNVFSGYRPDSPIRDHTENLNIIEQGVVSPEALSRIEKAEKGELKAKLAAILDRGIVEDRLKVDLPPELHGEWARNDPLEIRRLESLGFQIDNEYASKRAIHSDGSDSAIVGDVVHMICPIEIKQVIDEIRHEQMLKQHMKKRRGNKDVNKEELDFEESVKSEVAEDRHTIAYSQSQEKVANIADVIATLDSQVETHDKKK